MYLTPHSSRALVTKDLFVRYLDVFQVKIGELRADMIVLCPALRPKADNRALSDILGLELGEYPFFKTRDPLLAPVETNVEGIFTCGYCEAPKDISESVTQASAAAAKAAETTIHPIVR